MAVKMMVLLGGIISVVGQFIANSNKYLTIHSFVTSEISGSEMRNFKF